MMVSGIIITIIMSLGFSLSRVMSHDGIIMSILYALRVDFNKILRYINIVIIIICLGLHYINIVIIIFCLGLRYINIVIIIICLGLNLFALCAGSGLLAQQAGDQKVWFELRVEAEMILFIFFSSFVWAPLPHSLG